MCYNRRIRFATGILVLVCSSVLLDVVEATNNKNRRDAMTAGQPSKPKRGAAGKKEGSTQSRAERYGDCINKLNERIGVARRKGDTPQKSKERRGKFDDGSDSCADIDTFACTSGSNSGGGSSTNGSSTNGTSGGNRRLMAMVLGINLRDMPVEEARARMRDILAQVDEDNGVEAVNFDSTDDDQNAIGEHVAASLGDDNLDDLCTVAEDEDMGDMLRKYAGNKEHQKAKDSAGHSHGPQSASAKAQAMSDDASFLAASTGRKSLAAQLAHLRKVRGQLSSQRASQASAKAATQSANSCGKLSFVKATTRDKVACDANNLVEAIAPDYMTTQDDAFQSAVNGLETFGIIDAPTDSMYQEYSDSNKWGETYITMSVFKTTLSTLNQAYEIQAGACDIQEAFATWGGVGGGVALTPSKLWCGAIGLALKIALFVVELAFVEIVQIISDGAAGYDDSIRDAELEATAENVVGVMHNQKMTFAEVGNRAEGVIRNVKESENRTKTTVIKAAGDTISAIIAVEDKVDLLKEQLAAVQHQLSDLINQRACESTNQGASIHHTVNHMHRMMLIPEGLRPGYNNRGTVVPACDRTDPTLCSNPSGARDIRVKQVCADPTMTTLVAGAPLTMSTTPLAVTSATGVEP